MHNHNIPGEGTDMDDDLETDYLFCGCEPGGWVIMNADPERGELGQVQRCDSCRELASEESAWALAKAAGYTLDEDGNVLAAPAPKSGGDRALSGAGAGADMDDERAVNLHQTADATIWAAEFMRLFLERLGEIDEGLMLGWFANALMTGHDLALARREEATQAATVLHPGSGEIEDALARVAGRERTQESMQALDRMMVLVRNLRGNRCGTMIAGAIALELADEVEHYARRVSPTSCPRQPSGAEGIEPYLERHPELLEELADARKPIDPPQVHELRTWPAEFQAVLDGKKRHETRRNDRDFQPGDTVKLKEWQPKGHWTGREGHYTGRELTFTIGHVTSGPSWGLPEDLCVFTLQELAAWHPMRTAPMDGSSVLVAFDSGVEAVFWVEPDGWCVTDNKRSPMPLRGWRAAYGWLPLPDGLTAPVEELPRNPQDDGALAWRSEEGRDGAAGLGEAPAQDDGEAARQTREERADRAAEGPLGSVEGVDRG